ncbi:MAG: lipid A export permease/ATP-binding protein MsbA [Pseudomonadales bacterium]
MIHPEHGPEITGWQAYKRLLTYVGPYWPAFLVSLFGFGIYAATQASFAWLIKFVPVILGDESALESKVKENSDSLSFLPEFLQLSSPESFYYFLPVMLVAVVALRGFGSYLGGYYLIFVARHLVNNLRQSVFSRLLQLPGSFYNRHASGHLISTLTFNVEQVTGAGTDALKTIFRDGSTVMALLTYVFYLNWKLSLVFLVVGPLIGLVVSLTSKLFRKYSRRIQNSMGGVTHVASETFKGVEVVRAFGGNDYEQKRFADASEYNLKQSMKLALVDEVSTPFIQILTFIAIAVLLWIGLSTDIRGGMDTGEFLSYLTAASLIAKPLRQLTSVNSKIQKGIAASQSIFAMMDEEPERDTGTVELKKARGRLELRDVSFRYPGSEQDALRGINLTIEQGESVAFVGRSGSGKTTLVNLIPRFNNVSGGQITLDGLPLDDYRLRDLRRQVAIVNQQIVLFQDTVAHNIAYGDLAAASEQDIIDAATAAHALEFIEKLPQGLQTQVGEDGVMLSGGQRQRLALARAILKDAPLLILDEATSALDTESERYIQQALKGVMAGRTTLVIAHRLSTIENADKIVVMDQGAIVEVGNHQELLAKQGAYAQLHRLQFSDHADV